MAIYMNEGFLDKIFNKIIRLKWVFFVKNLYAQNADIVISGNERYDKQTIIVYGEVVPKKIYSKNDVNSILKKLYSTNFFENVKANYIDEQLLITVIEAPIIDKVEFNGIKSQKIQESLASFINLKSRSSYNDYLVAEDRKKIENYFIFKIIWSFYWAIICYYTFNTFSTKF